VLAFFSYIGIWVYYALFLFTILSCFFKNRFIKPLYIFFALPSLLLNLIFIPFIIRLISDNQVTTILYIFEITILSGLVIFNSIESIRKKEYLLHKNDIVLFVVVILCMIVASTPYQLPSALFGLGKIIKIKDFSFAHRVLLYIGLISPIVIYNLLKKKSPSTIKLSLLFLALATSISYTGAYTFQELFTTPDAWPFHLCNTAMYIVPICLIFNVKWLYYFTYFINVLGAFIALLLPNYSEIYLFSSSIVRFYLNHYIAFFLPILLVPLGIYPRPKIKAFYYSVIGFTAYFLFVVFLNSFFQNWNPDVNYFFVSGDFVPDKLGTWGKNLFRNYVTEFSIGKYTFTFHYLYQILFYFVYIFLSLGMWFIYENGFRYSNKVKIVNSYYNILQKEDKKFRSSMQLLGLTTIDKANCGGENMITIENFSKVYGVSKVYSAYDISLKVEAGTVFGLLGPNGAGKSTLIKCLVGIQPLTSGNMNICGYDLKQQNILAKMQIGFVPDHYALYEKLTGREYINYVADIYHVDKDSRIETIDKLVNRFNLAFAFDKQMGTYSHGMKQKIAIIASLVHNPKVWILDEPLTGLDPESIFQVKTTISEHAAQGNIVFFSSHLMDVVERLCEKVGIIKFGHLIEVREVNDILKTHATLEDYYHETMHENQIKAQEVDEDFQYDSIEKDKSKGVKSSSISFVQQIKNLFKKK
jgi:ABC-2 type transport system ATP-binding protein